MEKFDITKHLKSSDFKSKEEYKTFLTDVLKKLAMAGYYNIFMHQVDNHRTYLSGSKQEKIDGIKSSGLYIYPHATILATLAFVGNAKDVDVQKIVDYSFSKDGGDVDSFVFAIPKYITVDGKNVELSTIDGQSCVGFDKFEHKELTEKYLKEFGKKPIVPECKFCLLDVFDLTNLSNQFCLGVQHLKKDGSINFEQNEKHFSLLSEQEKQKLMSFMEEKTKKAYKRYNTKNLCDLIIEAYAEHKKYLDSCTDDYD